MSNHRLLWGIDLGGTKIEGAVLVAEDREPAALCRIRVATEAQRGYEHVLSQINDLVRRLAEAVSTPPSFIGFGTPGVLDPLTGTLKNSNTQCLNGMPLGRDLEKKLGVQVAVANDANCFALAEAVYGAGRGAATVFGVIMGTGVGGGVVIDGKVLSGAQGIAGEWGHNVLDPEGPPCYCGKRGCVETILSGPRLEQFYTGRSGSSAPLAEMHSRAQQGDEHARATIAHLRERFGQAISVIINILDPHVIVLGGGVSNVPVLYDDIAAAVRPWIFNNRVETRVVRNALGDSAGVFGAALLCRTGPAHA